MKKCIVISDSFKASLGSIEICEIAEKTILDIYPECEVISLPVADGGEGTVDCFLHALQGERVVTKAHGPYMEEMKVTYAKITNTVIIEMSSCAGLPLVGERKNPSLTTTYGVGEQIYHAVKNGATNIILGLGGSATNDCGCGCAAALGVEFRDSEGREFLPTGGNLSKIAHIDTTKAKELLKGVKLTAMCDIDNPMFGKTGAAHIFGPQKGADMAMVRMLDNELKAIDKTIKKELNIHVSQVPGAGAAGAMGAGVMAFLGAELKPGIETVLDIVDFDEKLKGADIVFTGEGKIDSQSMRGKVVYGVATRAKKHNVPVVAIVGDVDDDAYEVYDIGVSAIFSINRIATPFEIAKTRSNKDYANTLRDILKFMQVIIK
ncbi:MAG: glycerate kinase [Synergistaceae bacterium]